MKSVCCDSSSARQRPRSASHQHSAPALSSVSILSGLYKDAKLTVPPQTTHPMGSRERLALFNILGDLAGLRVLDLFAGSGALGLEALSRGASELVLVEKSPVAVHIIEANLRSLASPPARATVLRSSALALSPTSLFDLVLVDPPYDHPAYFSSENISIYAGFVKSGGTLVISHPKSLALPSTGELQPYKSRSYAALAIDFFHKV